MNKKKLSMAIAVSSNSDNRNNYYSKKDKHLSVRMKALYSVLYTKSPTSPKII